MKDKFLLKQEQLLKQRFSEALKEEITRQKLLYNKVFKHIPVYGKKYKDGIKMRAIMNIEARFV